jgi:putative ABC transport system substrate-binding protein
MARSPPLKYWASPDIRSKTQSNDVIVTAGATNALAAKQATAAIPIVFAGAGARQTDDKAGADRGRTNRAICRQAGRAPARNDAEAEPVGGHGRFQQSRTIEETVEIRAAAVTLGLKVAMLEIRAREDIAAAFEALKGRAEALNVVSSVLTFDNRVSINAAALTAGLPTMHGFRAHVVSGGLMSYGPNFWDLSRRAADYVDRILRGTKPADLPVQQSTKVELIINMKTAKGSALPCADAAGPHRRGDRMRAAPGHPRPRGSSTLPAGSLLKLAGESFVQLGRPRSASTRR